MRFSEHFGVQRPDDADWFDLNVQMDTPLYIDPFLLFEDADSLWTDAHNEVIEFFGATLDMLKLANGHEDSMHWLKAQHFLEFPEPKEFALGFSMGHPEGAGIGPDFAREICLGLDFFRKQHREPDDRILGIMAVLVDGLGVDRISDLVCNVLKSRFIKYTKAICGELSVPVSDLSIRNGGWVANNLRWQTTREQLPSSPVFNGSILLTPERFLKDVPLVSAEGFWNWAAAHEGERLRFDLNYDLAESLSQREKAIRGRELARLAFDMLDSYVDAEAANDSSYDVTNDPKGLVRWEEAGRKIAEASTAPVPPESQGHFEKWLIALATTFKTAIEDNGLWLALWNDDNTKHRKEKIAQVVARTTWLEHCKAHNVDITREADCGRGPVDFKFTQGWNMRGLIEVKHISNTKFFHGATVQLPIYLKGEEARFGVYLCIGYSDSDFKQERLDLVRDACCAIAKSGQIRMHPVFVDARPKASASTA
ncbi:hypothetical protein JGU71_24625 [Antrihabitans sp. YC3-6]|uniref:Uncharacterized protein n=1 Tax=Antrihabitans stalagmiti TaxID=2799499 RepID=A0A934U6M6_9NOCA|nr:hypothetical protein [Antrihabitans stalagmiti]MBJ8342078.1 hypothetical protein [Antrihabitans stalagmiti]